MVVSFDIHLVLAIVELILLVAYLVFIFVANKETWNKVVRLILASSLVIVNVAQLPMEVIMGKSYGWTIMVLIVWFINAILTAMVVGADAD